MTVQQRPQQDKLALFKAAAKGKHVSLLTAVTARGKGSAGSGQCRVWVGLLVFLNSNCANATWSQEI